jgi:tRNA pseudouridine38-40 synthase
MFVKAIISYDGSRFFGSAIQPHKMTVQGNIESALKILGINTKSIFSGRTDKDVHATNQVISFEVPEYWDNLEKLKISLNKIVQPYIYFKSITLAPDKFHARFDAKIREYRYLISTKTLTPHQSAYSYFDNDNIDLNLCKESIKELIGTHDFAFFSKKGSAPTTTVRTIYSIDIYRFNVFIVIKFRANAYLRSQIRMIVAFLLKISKGELSVEDLKDQLNQKRLVSTTLAPPNGLYLTKIRY